MTTVSVDGTTVYEERGIFHRYAEGWIQCLSDMCPDYDTHTVLVRTVTMSPWRPEETK